MKIRSKGYGFEIDILVHTKRPTQLLIIAYDASRENTMHIIRRYGESVPVLGNKVFTLPFPIEPKRVKIKVLDFTKMESIPFKIIKTRAQQSQFIPKSHLLKNFIHFAKEFSGKAGILPIGMYRAKNDNLTIQIVDQIRDEKGNKKYTPAHVYHSTGLIQVVKSNFNRLPVYTRLFILLHEFAHYYLETFDEVECDLFAWNICKNMGVSEYECFNSLFRVFDFIPEGSEKEKRIQILYKHIFKQR